MANNPAQPGGPLEECTSADYFVHSSGGCCGSSPRREHSAILKLQTDSRASEAAPSGYHGHYRPRRWLRCWCCMGTAVLLLFLPESCSLLAQRPKCASSGSQGSALSRWSSTGFDGNGSSGSFSSFSDRSQRQPARDVVRREGVVVDTLGAEVPVSNSAEWLLDGAVRTAAISAVPSHKGTLLTNASNGFIAVQSMLAVTSNSSAVATDGSQVTTDKSKTGAASSVADFPKAASEGSTSEKGTKQDVRSFYSFFVDPQALEHAIRSYGTDEKFYSIFHPLYKNRAIAQLINGLNDNGFEVKARLSRVVERHEGTLASDVEASDLGFMERKRRQEDTLHTGKTGIFIIIFKRLLDWVYGRDFLESAMRDRQAKWKILSRLSEYGVSEKDLTPAQLKAIVELQLSKKKPFKGVAFDPFAKEFPSLDVPVSEDVSGVDIKKLLETIEEKQRTEPESTTASQGTSITAGSST